MSPEEELFAEIKRVANENTLKCIRQLAKSRGKHEKDMLEHFVKQARKQEIPQAEIDAALA
jgi:CRISPR/Cas system CMR-associated protein Cmr1 (group 7 of RAMP superfamily)